MPWNETTVEFPSNAVLHELIEAQVLRTPHLAAAVYDGQEMTYLELEERANKLAHYLMKQGAGPDRVVGVCVQRSLELVVALYAVLKAGAAFMPLDPEAPLERLKQIVQDSEAVVCLTQEVLREKIEHDGVPFVFVDTDWAQVDLEPADKPVVRVTPANMISVYYTSGSTGKPKGVVSQHLGWVNRMCWMQNHFHLNAGETVLQKTTLTFDDSAVEFFWPLMVGGRIALIEPGAQVDPRAMIDAAIRYAAVHVQFVPSMLNLVLDEVTAADRQALTALRSTLSSGEALSATTVRRFFEKMPGSLNNTWGATEVSIDSTIHVCTPDDSDEEGAISVGKPIDNNRVYVLDEQLQPVEIGVTGELYLAGIGVAKGYLNDPERTAKAFLADPFAPGERMYKTGDLGYFRPDGSVKFIGRADNQVKIRGMRVELGEIESALLRHENVKEAIVLLQETAGLKRLIGYVVPLDADHALKSEELRSMLKELLPEYMVPSYIMTLDAMPLNANGKTDRKAFPVPNISRQELGAGYVAPQTELQAHLCSIFADVLGLDDVGAEDDFFELGGDSITATQVMSRLRASVNGNVNLKIVFEQPNAVQLAAAFEAQGWTVAVAGQQQMVIEPVGRDQDLPLSFTQERLWFVQQMDAESAVYNEPYAYRLTGELDADALQTALTQVVQRHETLRTSFGLVGDLPVQRIAPDADLQLELIDLTDVPGEQREALLQAKLTEQSRVPFSFEKAPLIRVVLFRVNVDEHVLFINLHHIITDGWSGVVFLEELGLAYEAALENGANPLGKLPFQYADFVVWQRKWLESGEIDAQLPFWKAELAGAQTLLQLPTDHPRPALPTYEGDRLHFSIPAKLAAQVAELGQEADASLYMVLLAAYNILLHRYSRQQDILVGSPIANRTMPGLDRLIGFFVNMIVLRSEFDGELSFAEYLQAVKERCLNVYNHQDVPFDRLVRELQVERNQAHAPLTQVVFAFQNKLEETLALRGLDVSPLEVNAGTSRYDLTLFLTETESGALSGIFEYNTGLFKRETMERMQENFVTLLESIVAEAAQKISELPIVSEGQRAQLAAWNDNSVEFPSHRVLHELIEEQVQKTPHLAAAVYQEQEITYLELEERANKLAHALIKQGVGPDRVVGVCVQRSLELVIALYAVLKAGGAFLPLDPEAPLQRLKGIIEDSQAVVCLTQEALREKVWHEEVPFLFLDTDWAQIDQESAEKPNVQVTPDNMISVYYTSGSTGKPKGVVSQHLGWVNRMCWMQNHFQLQQGESVLQKTTLTFDDSAVEFFWPLMVGGRIALIEPGAQVDPRAMIDDAIRYEVVHIQFVPSMLNLVLDELTEEDKKGLCSLRSTLSSGEALSPTTVRRFFEKMPGSLNNTWGATEVSIDSTIHVCTADDLLEEGAVCVGKPIDNNRCYVLDEHLQPVPVGVSGDLYLAGIGVAKGYLNDPERTLKAFMDDPFVPGERMYKTGDLGYCRPDGSLKFIGRADNQVKIRGMRVELGEIEAALLKHDNVKEALVIVHDTDGLKRLVGYVVALDAAQGLSMEELRNMTRDLLPDYMVPSFLMQLDAMPLNANGKADRKQLPMPDRLPHQSSAEFVEPEGPVQEVLADIWMDILKLEKVSAGDDFFDLGGHSLLATQVVSRIRGQFSVELPLRTLFAKPLFHEMAEEVETRLMEMLENMTEEEALALLHHE
ncbi:non-ribosomal peptide synthetase [Tumebacillus avium]|uniref:Non-ribosomal peptide synthetase n=1 Tax=Tumebacillus avium TaxID=1903704 RepID=A0A1Y0ILX6_9BACL|nr:non-ribosomal peptide synthetase [Tumebacillus avium]ARU60334.1 non-ribosomal peptide synthetase [Tumebacillus avium]